MAEVTCARCARTAEALERAPLGGALGREVLARVCRDCWQEWRDESFRLINHLGIQPIDPAQRQRLYGLLREYLRIGDGPSTGDAAS